MARQYKGGIPMATMNRQVLLARRPQAQVSESDFRIVDAPLRDPAEGEVAVRNEFLSLDPYMRGRMSDAKSYVPPANLDEVMVGQTVGEVIASRNPRFAVGDKVLTNLGWQRYGVASGDMLTKVDAKRAPLSYYLGILGMPGVTAWFGLSEIGQPKAGETMVVSAASGAVGSVAGQLGRLKGCRVVGIAGGRDKCDYVVRELGFDACVDHRSATFRDDLKAACPNGIDVDFENAGGPVLESILMLTNKFARIIICGLVAEYSAGAPYANKNLRAILVNRIRMQGMIVYDWKERFGEAIAGLAPLVADGRLKYRESIAEGLDNAPAAFMGLLQGKNFGKQLVKLP
jgi:NADPH-dependent curcumin reductase CurA